jgi:hypothetical protein
MIVSFFVQKSHHQNIDCFAAQLSRFSLLKIDTESFQNFDAKFSIHLLVSLSKRKSSVHFCHQVKKYIFFIGFVMNFFLYKKLLGYF